jgi:hypothetical protein
MAEGSRSRIRLAGGAVGAAVLLPIVTFVVWQEWRAHSLRAFCDDVRVGMRLTDLLEMEKRHGIDESYLMSRDADDFAHQDRLPDMTFRSYRMDPDFECSILNNGISVTAVSLVPEWQKGLSP